MHIRAIVCDVGHVIVQESVLNHVLQALGRRGAMRVLYDMDVLAGAAEEDVERWVEGVIREKLKAMAGVRLAELQQLACELPLTPGLPELVGRCQQAGVAVMLMGAVPTFLTRAMVMNRAPGVDKIVGTEIAEEDGHLAGASVVCTPLRKAAAVQAWLAEKRVAPMATAVIGDSIGDLPTMGLVPKPNRFAFNAHPDVVAKAGHSDVGSMLGIMRRIFGHGCPYGFI